MISFNHLRRQNGQVLLNRSVRLIIISLAIAIAFNSASKLGLAFASLPGKVTAVWLPSGLTLAFATWLGLSALPGIAIGVLFGSVPDLLTWHLSITNFVFLNLAFVAANCLQPAVGMAMVHQLTGTEPNFRQVRSVVAFILAAVVSPMFSATIGITALCLVNIAPWAGYGTAWLTWWLASLVAHLLFTPALLLWRPNWGFHSGIQLSEMLMALGLSLGLSWVVFMQNYHVEYTLVPVLIWAVFRLGSWFTSILVSLISAIAIMTTAQGSGPFIVNSTGDSLLLLQSFIAVCSITTLILGADIHERQAAELALAKTLDSLEQQVEERTVQLRESEATLDGFFAAAPAGLGIVDGHLRYVRINQLLSEMNGVSIQQHLGQTIRQVLPDLAASLEPAYQQVLMTGQPILNREEPGKNPIDPGADSTYLTSYFPIASTTPASSKVGVIVMDISDRKRLENQLQQQAQQDGLTSLANRHQFNQISQVEWQRCLRHQQPLSLILLDIDQFKRYNDTYGHLLGDQCLIQFANLLTGTVKRPGDLVARYGGEEFVVLLPETTAAGALHIAELIRQHLHQQQIPHKSSAICPFVTASMGIATVIPTPDLQLQQVLQSADEALYKSKRQGRDRITCQQLAHTS